MNMIKIFLFLTVLMFSLMNCGTGISEEPMQEGPTYEERLEALSATYDQDFIRLIQEANDEIGETVIRYSAVSDEFSIPKYMEIEGSHYDYGRVCGIIGRETGIRLQRVGNSERALNGEIIAMYRDVYPQFIEIVRGVGDIYSVSLEEIDFRTMEQGFFNDLWYLLFRYPEFEALRPPSMLQSFEGNCAVVSAKVGNDVLVGRNFDHDRVRPDFIMKTRLDGVYEVMSNACYSLYHWVMDGINEKGLVMATANSAAPEEYYRYFDPYPDFPVINEHHMFRVALETCATVDEVISLYRRVRPWVADYADHLMVVDAAGNSAVIMIGLDRNPVFFRSSGNYQVMTNTVLIMGEEYLMENCWRYRTATQMAEEGISSLDDVKEIMRAIRGLPFGYMSLYDIKNGFMRVIPRHDWHIELDFYLNIR